MAGLGSTYPATDLGSQRLTRPDPILTGIKAQPEVGSNIGMAWRVETVDG
jgi:hypothetical protein